MRLFLLLQECPACLVCQILKVFVMGGPLHMDEQRQDNQQEPIYNSFVPIQDTA